MAKLVFNLPTFSFIVATRAALGVGIGLLVSQHMRRSQRRRLGSALLAIGAATTVPAVMALRRASVPRAALPL